MYTLDLSTLSVILQSQRTTRRLADLEMVWFGYPTDFLFIF